jgi:hypothetical protein
VIDVKALSVRQPWAWLIVAGYKDVENRKWATNFRGKIYIHAGKILDRAGLTLITSGSMNINQDIRDAVRHNSWTLGAIIGEVEIVDCVTQSDSPWFKGPYAFVLERPALYERPIPCKGKLGFFEPE